MPTAEYYRQVPFGRETVKWERSREEQKVFNGTQTQADPLRHSLLTQATTSRKQPCDSERARQNRAPSPLPLCILNRRQSVRRASHRVVEHRLVDLYHATTSYPTASALGCTEGLLICPRSVRVCVSAVAVWICKFDEPQQVGHGICPVNRWWHWLSWSEDANFYQHDFIENILNELW